METVSPGEFDGLRLNRPGAWAVAFLADWCPFCREFRPLFEAFEGTGPFQTAVADLTDDENPLWERFGIEVVPSLIAFVDGRPTLRVDGISMEGLGPRDLERLRAAFVPPSTGSRAVRGAP